MSASTCEHAPQIELQSSVVAKAATFYLSLDPMALLLLMEVRVRGGRIMAGIFISYSKKHAQLTEEPVRDLEAEAYTAWVRRHLSHRIRSGMPQPSPKGEAEPALYDVVKRLVGPLRQALIHAFGGIGRPGSLDNASGNADGRASCGNALSHERPGGDLGIGPDLDIADNLSARANKHAGPDLGMPIRFAGSGPAKRDPVQDRDIVFDYHGLASHKSRCMVEKHALADLRGGMNVRLEYLG